MPDWQHLWHAYAKPALAYRTTRQIRVDMWQIGLAHRVLQLIAVTWVLFDLVRFNSWAFSETPTGTVNAWEESGRGGFAATYRAPASDFPYCSNASHDFVYSASFQYRQPECRALQPEEVVTKGVDSIAFTTSMISTVELGWRCGTTASAAAKEAECAAFGVNVSTDGVQCSCVHSSTFYVKGVERMQLAFEHRYEASSKVGSIHGVSNQESCARRAAGALSSAACTDHPLDTTVDFGTPEASAAAALSSLATGLDGARPSPPPPNTNAAHAPPRARAPRHLG